MVLNYVEITGYLVDVAELPKTLKMKLILLKFSSLKGKKRNTYLDITFFKPVSFRWEDLKNGDLINIKGKINHNLEKNGLEVIGKTLEVRKKVVTKKNNLK